MEKIKKQISWEKLLCGAAFFFFLLITTHKLTNASLWYDEVVEYWYSKIMFGRLPFPESTYMYSRGINMYERIINTFQPPLYNVLMYFWLMISDSEWWFRFFGVVVGFIGMIGLYKTVHKIGNGYLAAFAVFLSTCVYRLAYYWQECAEYCIMLAALFWTVYFWICLIDKPTRKNIIYFTISAVIPVYSQYGAIFPVFAMAAVAFIYVLAKKDRETISTIIISYLAALLIAALPLYLLFLKPQMLRQSSGGISLETISFTGGILKDFIKNFLVVLEWNFFSYYSDATIKIFFVIIAVMIIFTLALSRSNKVRLFIVINVITWVLYYLSVKLDIYSYGSFGRRYSLFFIPLWIVLLFFVAIEFSSILARYLPEKFEIKALCVGIGICFVLTYSYFSWDKKLQNNWSKENNRAIVEAWYEAGAEDSNTIIYYTSAYGFAYYARQDSRYNDTTENNVHYMAWYEDKTEDEYIEYVNSIYGDDWSDEIYLVVTHAYDDLDTLITAIMSEGYVREDLYSSRGYLIRFSKS